MMITAASLARASDSLAAAPQPPGGIAVAAAPQFVLLGFDDNPQTDPMAWFTGFLESQRNPAGAGRAATFDGAPVRAAFYTNGKYLDQDESLRAVHRRAFAAGHEMANHTQNHGHGHAYTREQWRDEMVACTAAFARSGIPAAAIRGFRTPFLEHNPATFAAAEELGFTYDTSLEEGDQAGQDGRNFLWPYTLHEGSPGNAEWAKQTGRPAVGRHPALWEIPIHVFLVPADERCADYGVKPGLRERLRAGIKQTGGWDWSAAAGKITGLDWNVLEAARAEPEEFLAILKYTLDLRLAGNRAPFMVGGHTALFPANSPGRRKAMEEFIAYALTKPEVRFVTPVQLIDWLRKPAALGGE